MSDAEENEKYFLSTEEDEQERSSFMKSSRRRKDLTELRHPRQKFCRRWETDFPWLKGDKIDESIGICTVCNKKLVCKKSHLERHEKSYKHQRLGGLDTEDECSPMPTAPEFLECGKRELEDEEEFGIELLPDTSGVELESQNVLERLSGREDEEVSPRSPRSTSRRPHQGLVLRTYSAHKSSANRSKLDRNMLLKHVERDRQELNEYFYTRPNHMLPHASAALHSSAPAPVVRDCFDLFFDSVSASVKTLPPKLAAEVKSRVSQIIAEYEVRAICEREAQAHRSSVDTSEIVVATSTHGAVDAEADEQVDGTMDPSVAEVPRIVYRIQQK